MFPLTHIKPPAGKPAVKLLASLRTFVRKSEIGCFTATAAELGVAPSLISRQLSAHTGRSATAPDAHDLGRQQFA